MNSVMRFCSMALISAQSLFSVSALASDQEKNPSFYFMGHPLWAGFLTLDDTESNAIGLGFHATSEIKLDLQIQQGKIKGEDEYFSSYSNDEQRVVEKTIKGLQFSILRELVRTDMGAFSLGVGFETLDKKDETTIKYENQNDQNYSLHFFRLLI